MTTFEEAVEKALGRASRDELCALAERIRDGGPIPSAWSGTALARLAAIVDSLAGYAGSRAEAGAYLLGAAVGYERRRREQRVQVVWGGPVVHGVPIRGMGQVLADVIGRAEKSLLLMTYSAKPYEPVIAALSAALGRGVAVSVVVETLQGAGSAINGPEPAAAFGGLAGIELWHWPKKLRPNPKAKMHAKIAIGDRREMLVSSANITASGIDASMEAGLLVRGGEAPRRADDQIRELMTEGTIVRLT